MKLKAPSPKLLLMLLTCLSLNYSANAQLAGTFTEVFNEILGQGGALQLSPGEHGSHYVMAAESAAANLSPVLNLLIANNISSFPLSSTAAGFSHDFSSGRPVKIRESLGPIFAETGRTLGKGKINFGVNHTILNPNRFRGLKTEDMTFFFSHLDVGEPGLGDSANESDVLGVALGLNLNAGITAIYFTAGLTEDLDVSVALPLINLKMEGNMVATMNSFTFIHEKVANHHFGQDPSNPVLSQVFSYQGNAAGIGDLAVRAKYGFLKNTNVQAAIMGDVRLPTGDTSNFLGTGHLNARLVGIVSGKVGDFSPHLNIGYDYRDDENDSDEFEFALGFDQKLAPGFTFALDLLGEFDLQDPTAFSVFSDTKTIVDRIKDVPGDEGTVVATRTRQIINSNVPVDIDDHILSLAAGFRIAPSDQFQILGNVLVPLNDGGLRSDVVGTFGVSFSLN